ncbi:hypothetical protein SAY87_004081 [Trapa incisa]|uniref:Uncharacterized protein n=1 Tax=Trapa incisa TaxID=236973 RepID=A0AAN7JNG4_9MYRT|nr:hypothetical protein SAY87_004081 [Trapa incisa]
MPRIQSDDLEQPEAITPLTLLLYSAVTDPDRPLSWSHPGLVEELNQLLEGSKIVELEESSTIKLSCFISKCLSRYSLVPCFLTQFHS